MSLNKLISHYILVRGISHRLKTDLQAEIDLIYSDKNHFESVIINLLDNAFKHGGADVNVGFRHIPTMITFYFHKR